jgi:hypothetical protein
VSKALIEHVSRRRFLKTSAIATIGMAAMPSFEIRKNDEDLLRLVVDPEDDVASAPSSRWALDQIQEALRRKGVSTCIVPNLSEVSLGKRCIVVSASAHKNASTILNTEKVAVPSSNESLALVAGTTEGRSVLLVSGHDARGLVYAALELVDRIRLEKDPWLALSLSRAVSEKPANRIRGVYRCFTSEVEDKAWFYDREVWKEYLSMLAMHRFNRFSLMLGMGYNTPNRNIKDSYFFFAYPFLLAVPGYDIKMGGLPDAERDRNLEMLTFISEEAVARGLDFQLGLWSHGREWPDSPEVNYPLLGVTAENHASFCRDALTVLLKKCPAIGGITLRVHSESGVPESEFGFWQTFFEAFRNCGRRVAIDLHAKNVTQAMIDVALSTGMPLTLSPKYWGEHQGMGYIPASIREQEMLKKPYMEEESGVGLGSRSFTRYSYGDYLREDRPYSVMHRIWPGTQRLLLSGDPILSSAYGRVSNMCGLEGIDLHDPLTFKGRQGTGLPGNRTAYADKHLVPKYDWMKFSYTYRLWGRLMYNPDADPEIWRRFLRVEFTGVADAVEKALASASQVLTLMTTFHAGSPDCQVYWPEIYLNVPIVDPVRAGTVAGTKPAGIFGSVSSFDPQLFWGVNAYADALLEGPSLPKYTPIEVAQRLEDLASAVFLNLKKAGSLIVRKNALEFERFAIDMKIQAHLALFFSAKIRSAVLWRIYQQSNDRQSLVEASSAYRRALDAWTRIVEETENTYQTDITFGARINLRGSWSERIQAIKTDLAKMERHLDDDDCECDVKGDESTIEKARLAALGHPTRAFIVWQHTKPESFLPGKVLPLEVSIPDGVSHADLYYRRVNQALLWEMVPMTAEESKFRAVIPAEYTRTNFPLQYYFVMTTKEGPVICPGLDEQFMNQPYYVLGLKKEAH